MPFYYTISKDTQGKRTAERLLAIQNLLAKGSGGDLEDPKYTAPVPARTLNDTLLLATWNIREFDSSKYGLRRRESYFYIAEVISHFDLVAVQEVREDLTPLNRLVRILGDRHWDYLVSDVTEGAGGNSERMAYLYDRRKVQPSGLVGEIVLPPKKGKATRQLARSPFLVGFQAGWFKFSLCTVHIYYGGDEPSPAQRVQEIDDLAKFLAKRVKRYRKKYRDQGKSHSEYESVALLGDFNIFDTQDETFKALKKNGFIVPEGLVGKITNIGKKGHSFDQIAFLEDEDTVEVTGHSGIVDFYKVVFTNDDRDVYRRVMDATINASNEGKAESRHAAKFSARSDRKKTTYYRAWRTFQLSDHLPLWMELRINFSRQYLERKANPDGDE